MGHKSGEMENLVEGPFAETFRNKKVFLTGHTGFKGSWLLGILSRLGAKTKGYALAPINNNDLYNVLNSEEPLCESIIHDIRDREKLREEIINFSPDFIFHLAAQPLVRASYDEPVETFEVNIIGTTYVLECVRELKKKCTVIIVTTDKVYHNFETLDPYKESDPLGGHDPYSASKAAAEIVTTSYGKSFFNPANVDVHRKGLASARAGNVIGGGDWSKDRIIPDLIRSMENNTELSIRNPDAVRPWQHVLEPLSGYLLLASRLDKNPATYGGAWNFGPDINDTLSVKDLIEKSFTIWGSGEYAVKQKEDQPHEAGLLKLDITKAGEKLGWKPKFNAEESIEWTLNWYKQPTENRRDYTFFQIDQYLEL